MNLKRCPFCGGKIMTAPILGLPMMFFKCMNFNSCGATISFDNPEANSDSSAAVKYFNRRTDK